jgi:hypothetical protein
MDPKQLYKQVERDLTGEDTHDEPSANLSYEIDKNGHLVAWEFDEVGALIGKYVVSVIVVPVP